MNAKQMKEVVDRIKASPGAWEPAFREAMARREFALIASASLGDESLDALGLMIANECDFDEPITWAWYDAEQRRHIDDIVVKLGAVKDETDRLKLQVEAMSDSLKGAKGNLAERQDYMGQLARAISQPYIPPMPPLPERQQPLFPDGEEWRAVPLGTVLADLPALQAVALSKIGNVSLGEYADFAAARASGKGPKKISDKQAVKIEEAVQKWHAAQQTERAEPEAVDSQKPLRDEVASEFRKRGILKEAGK